MIFGRFRRWLIIKLAGPTAIFKFSGFSNPEYNAEYIKLPGGTND